MGSGIQKEFAFANSLKTLTSNLSLPTSQMPGAVLTRARDRSKTSMARKSKPYSAERTGSTEVRGHTSFGSMTFGSEECPQFILDGETELKCQAQFFTGLSPRGPWRYPYIPTPSVRQRLLFPRHVKRRWRIQSRPRWGCRTPALQLPHETSARRLQ